MNWFNPKLGWIAHTIAMTAFLTVIGGIVLFLLWFLSPFCRGFPFGPRGFGPPGC